MPRMIYDYTKSELESVSINPNLFKRKLKKAVHSLLPHEIDHLQKWLSFFTVNKPDLQNCLLEVDIEKFKNGVC
jgi:predicted SprT family Zn-dependent metalloprotease